MSLLLDKHWDKWIAAPNGCYIWCASFKSSGYPQVNVRNSPRVFSRMICEETHGPRAYFLKLDASHLCEDRRCVRPEHLIWESRGDNEKRKSAEKKRAKGLTLVAAVAAGMGFKERARRSAQARMQK
jgi:hypothetical protein